MEGVSEERYEKAFDETPVPMWKTGSAESIFRMDSLKNRISPSNILGHLEVELDLVAVIPQVPCDIKEFHNKRCCPAFTSIMPS
jgi:hypothetical protein